MVTIRRRIRFSDGGWRGCLSGLGVTGLLLSLPAAASGGGEMPSLVHDIGYCAVLAGVLAIVFTRLQIPVIAAFLVAGVVVGPVGAKLVTDPANIETIARLGLILLLFLIGLEIDFRKLLASGRILVLSGLLQYPLSVAFGLFAARLFVWLGLGRMSLGILIFQDIWAIAIIAVQPSFTDPQIVPILFSFLGVGVLALIALLCARFIIPIGFRWVAKMPEVILVAAVSWCFIVVFIGMNIDAFTRLVVGIDLHMAVGPGMGALIAGASIASLPYSTEIVGKVGVVKDFFVTLFFVGLGMGIPLPDGFEVLMVAALLAALALLARYLVFFPLLYFTGLDRGTAMVTSTRLAQISEFSLVISFIGMQLGHITHALNSAIIFAFVITALLTPTLYRQADRVHEKLAPLLERIGFRAPASREAGAQESYRLALLGFHRVASSLLHELGKTHPGLLAETLVVDFNVSIHDRIAALGPAVKYGDLRNPETLRHAGVDKADVIVCTIPDDVLKGTSNLQLVEVARALNPEAVVIANAVELKDSRKLYEAGADYVFLPRVETARAVERAIVRALAGEIGAYRAQVESVDGEWHTRREVL
jgi:Kef-type K+ transport system membrane component KefB